MISVENEPQQIRLVCRWNEKIVQHTRSEWRMYLYKSYGNGRTCQYSTFRNSSSAYRWPDEEKSCTRTHTRTPERHAFTQTIDASTKIFAEKIEYSKIRSQHRQMQQKQWKQHYFLRRLTHSMQQACAHKSPASCGRCHTSWRSPTKSCLGICFSFSAGSLCISVSPKIEFTSNKYNNHLFIIVFCRVDEAHRSAN